MVRVSPGREQELVVDPRGLDEPVVVDNIKVISGRGFMEPQSPGFSEPPGFSVSIVAGRTLLATLAFGLAWGVVLVILYRHELHNEQLLHQEEGTHHLELQTAMLTREFDAIRSDLLFLTEQAILRDFTTRGRPGKMELRQEYLLFSRTKQIYDQIRYIDEMGRESVRIDFHDGRPMAAPEDQLQDKSGRHYFEGARGLQRGLVYVSPLDLNVEHGRIEEPLKPVVRFAAPVFDESGQHRGIVVLNYLGRKLIDELIDVSPGTPGSTMLLDSKGHWLHGPTAEDEWGFLFGNEHTYGLAHPGAWQRISSSPRGQFIDQDGLTSFATIVYPRDGPMRGAFTLRLIHILPRRDLYARSDQLLARLLWGYGAVVVLIAISAGFMASANAVRKQRDWQIRTSEERLRLLSSQLLNAQEEERARISRDIHDDLGQLATTALLQLRMANRLTGEQARTGRIQQATEAVERVLERSHELAAGLRPPMLHELGLEATVETYLSEFEAHSGIEVHADLHFCSQELPALISQYVYRILQEALTNVVKHAAVDEVFVKLDAGEHRITLIVRDAGVGFRPEIVNSSGLGMLGMRERVELLGGRFEVVSQPGGGTQIRADLPLEAS
jgi:signal transduction histidine kinase